MYGHWRSAWTPWAAAAGVSVVVASWLAGAASFYRYDADSIVPRLTSTMHWTFFYWEVGRNGQLLPLLAMPFANPLWNLVAQQWLGTVAGVMAIYLVVMVSSPGAAWFASGTAGVACFLVGASSFGHTLYLEGSQTYGTGMAFVLGGLLLAQEAAFRREDAARIAGATLLVAIGLWVNFLIFIFAAALVAVRGLAVEEEPAAGHPAAPRAVPELIGPGLWLMPPPVRRWIHRVGVSVAILCGGLVVVLFLSIFVATGGGGHRLSFSAVPLLKYPQAVAAATRGVSDMIVGPGGAMLIAAAAVAAAWLEGRGVLPRAVIVLATSATVFFLVVAGLQWVTINGSHPRYLLPAAISAYACIGMLYASVFRETLGPVIETASESLQRSLRWAVVATVPLALFVCYGWPDAAAPRRALATLGSPLAEKVVKSGVDFVAGDYWTLWPVVFKANLILYERGESRRVWGLGCRAGPTRHRWPLSPDGGTAVVAHLARAARPAGQGLDWIARHLDLEIGDREGAVGALDLYRFRLRSDRIASR